MVKEKPTKTTKINKKSAKIMKLSLSKQLELGLPIINTDNSNY